MSKTYAQRELPQLNREPLLTDGGLETTLVFHHGIDLPCFAAFDLLRREHGRKVLANYFRTYLALARQVDVGFLLESTTWRANPAWGPRLGYDLEELANANREAIALMHELRAEEDAIQSSIKNGGKTRPLLISGNVGPRGDGYIADQVMETDEATAFHRWQMPLLAEAGVDLVSAYTISVAAEAIGITQAASEQGLPVVISFTLETDGRLPSGQPLGEAIEQVDEETECRPAYYMINCAHPIHFCEVLGAGGGWRERIYGLRANASRLSHQELDAASELDSGDPQDLAQLYRHLVEVLPNLVVLGGCCGTDRRHVEAIGRATLPILWEGLHKI